MKSKRLLRILSIILALCLLLGLSACGKTIGTGDGKEAVVRQDTTEESTTNKETTSNKETTTSAEATTEQPAINESDQSGGYVPEDPVEPSGEYVPGGSAEIPTEPPTDPPAPTWTISVTVDAKAHGGVFASGVYTFSYQPTAYDALVSTGLSYTGSSSYVSSINGLGEFDYGRMSGWLYAVNGVDPSVGCGSYYLEDGDTVYWHYADDYTQE